MGAPTTSRDRIVVAGACFSGGSVLTSARLSACVPSYERAAINRLCSTLFFVRIVIFTFRFCLDTSTEIRSKTKAFRCTIYDYHSVWTCPDTCSTHLLGAGATTTTTVCDIYSRASPFPYQKEGGSDNSTCNILGTDPNVAVNRHILPRVGFCSVCRTVGYDIFSFRRFYRT